MPERSYTSTAAGYRWGFQAQEKDDEIKGEGNSINYKYRMHDPRIGRFFALDPLEAEYPFDSPYAFSGNRVIDMVEQEGLQPSSYLYHWFTTMRPSFGMQQSQALTREAGIQSLIGMGVVAGAVTLPYTAPIIAKAATASFSFGARVGVGGLLTATRFSNQIMDTGNRLMLSNPGATGNWMSLGSSIAIQENIPLMFSPTKYYPSLIGMG
jgi:RHS repeat-associated protein